VDKPNKPQQASEEEATAAAPPPPLPARSPYRPLSSRRRQEQVVEPPPAVERPAIRRRFDASPTTIRAALAKARLAPDEGPLAWKPDGPSLETARDRDDSDDSVTVEVDPASPQA
jgi:hypothetical protein